MVHGPGCDRGCALVTGERMAVTVTGVISVGAGWRGGRAKAACISSRLPLSSSLSPVSFSLVELRSLDHRLFTHIPCPPSPCISFSSFIQNKSSAPYHPPVFNFTSPARSRS